MKTDRFNDSIRRKLESIRPEFNEKEWARMQATLQQANPPSAESPTTHQPFTVSRWSYARPWLMAAATVSAVVLVSFAAWQGVQIANLRKTVSQLTKQQATRPRQTRPQTTSSDSLARPVDEPVIEAPAGTSTEPSSVPASDRPVASTHRTDTVYITRYVPVPASPAGSPSPDRAAQRSENAPRLSSGESLVRPDDKRILTGVPLPKRQATRTPQLNRADQAPANELPASDGKTDVATSKPGTVNRNQPTRETTTVSSGQPDNLTDTAVPVSGETVGASDKMKGTDSRNAAPAAGRVNGRTATQPRELSGYAASGRKKRSSVSTTDDPSGNNSAATPAAPGTPTTEVAEVTTQPAASYAPASNRPLTLASVDWTRSLAYQAKRMRPARTTVVGGQPQTTAPESQPVKQVAVGFRIGAGGDISSQTVGGGIISELLIGKHIALGVGLSASSYAGSSFGSDREFDYRMRRNFKHDYARGIDPRIDIRDIDIYTQRVHMPLTFSYRLPLTKTLSLLPSMGTVLNLQSTEFVTFSYREPFQPIEQAKRKIDRPVCLLNTFTIGMGMEWQRRHWVGQIGPLLTVPTLVDTHWQDGTHVGLRARVFYQF